MGRGFVQKLFLEHGQALKEFISRRIRSKGEASDLAQEVYLRILRVDWTSVRNPEGYLYTVAGNLLKEQRLVEERRARQDDAESPSLALQLSELPAFDSELDSDSRRRRLLEVLDQLPSNCRAAVVLQYRDGLSYQEIAERLGVSTHAVKKYLAQALVHCRKRMIRWR